jgi:geranylgeranyl pyrophosphate synthase
MYGDALALNAGTAAYFMGERLLNRSLVDDAAKLKLYDLYFEALREGHAGQAIDIDGLAMFVPAALDSGDLQRLEERVLAIHRLKTAAPAAALARMGGIAGGGTAAQVEAVGNYFEAMGLAFQMIDDVLNLRGFKGDLKQKGEDLSQGKVTLPVVKAFARLDVKARWNLWHLISSRPQDPEVVGSAIASIEACGALDACEQQAKDLVNSAWEQLDPVVPDSLAKMMLRAFGWYVLERHY